MLRERQRLFTRLLMGGFALSLAFTLGLWAWTSGASSASLSASPSVARQNDTVTLTGAGFAPGELVSVWITYPDFRVYGVAELEASADGAFSYPYLPDFLGATFTPTGSYTYTARGQSSAREVYASISVDIGLAPGPSAGASLSAEPGRDAQGSFFVFRGSGYAPSEEVAFWLRYPDNTVEDLGRALAGPGGLLEYTIYVTGAPVGRYAITGRGLSSGANGIAEFDVQVADLTVGSGVASLTVGPSPDTQRSYADFTGSGFAPGELVSVWVTLPDYSTLWIGDVTADTQGAFRAVLYLSEQEPVGRRAYTAYGNGSGMRAVAEYTLQPGSTDPADLVPSGDLADALCSGEGCS